MDQVICDALRHELDAQIAFSPGFRWGTTVLAGQPITMEDVLAETAITYPEVYVQEMTGSQIKAVMEDIVDNLFNPDPYYQQGGDMVRIGGMDYACAPGAATGSRISDMTLDDGTALQADKTYRVAGWASVNPQTASRSAKSSPAICGRKRSSRSSAPIASRSKAWPTIRDLAKGAKDDGAVIRRNCADRQRVGRGRAVGILIQMPPAAAAKNAAVADKPFAEHHLVLQLSDNDAKSRAWSSASPTICSNSTARTGSPSRSLPSVPASRCCAPKVRTATGRQPDSQGVQFDICMNTVETLERETGQRRVNPNAKPVEAGVAQILALTEKGYTLVRP